MSLYISCLTLKNNVSYSFAFFSKIDILKVMGPKSANFDGRELARDLQMGVTSIPLVRFQWIFLNRRFFYLYKKGRKENFLKMDGSLTKSKKLIFCWISDAILDFRPGQFCFRLFWPKISFYDLRNIFREISKPDQVEFVKSQKSASYSLLLVTVILVGS